jgi:hypothetical protein
MDYIVKDSTAHRNSNALEIFDRNDCGIKMGIVREIYQSSTSEIKYIVEVQYSRQTMPVVCSLMTRWGGVQNFEEYSLRPYHGSAATDAIGGVEQSMETRVGDVVIIACMQGNYREGVILGGLRHPGRKSKIPKTDLAYISQFNGIETTITKSGGYKITNKGVINTPLDLALPGAPIMPELNNPLVAGSYFELGDDGSFTVNDNANQIVKIDKTSKQISIKSGTCELTLDLVGNKISTSSTNLELKSDLKTDITTTSLNMEAKLTAKLKAKQVAIGNDSFELIDGLVKLIDAIGTLVVISPNGPCNPIQGAATWSQIVAIKQQLNLLKGSL